MKSKKKNRDKSSPLVESTEAVSSRTDDDSTNLQSKGAGESQPPSHLANGEVKNENEIEQTVELSQIVEESKARLAEAEQVPVKPRRRRRTRAEMEAARTTPGAGGVQPAAISAITPEAKELSEVLQFTGMLAVKRTGFAGWTVAPDEADLHGGRLDRCFKKWMPQISEGTLLLSSTIISLGIAVGMRYMSYQDWIKENESRNSRGTNRESNNEQRTEGTRGSNGEASWGSETHTIADGPATSASDFFPKNQ